MILKTIQWNIGGGKLAPQGSDTTKLGSYTVDGMQIIISFVKEHSPDIVTLQETHSSDGYSQTELIAKALGCTHWVDDSYADSHVEAGQRLGQAIISRYPLSGHSFDWFTNPKLEAVWEDGTTVTSHDKGRTRVYITLPNDLSLCVQTSHSLPLRRFGKTPGGPEGKAILVDMSARFLTDEAGLIQGDFNVDAESLATTFPELFGHGYAESKQITPTTPKGHRYDHILYKGLELQDAVTVQNVDTDHYPVIATFEVNEY